MKKDNKVFKLQGKVQHYAWGGTDFLPRLLSLPNPDKKPFAEYWMGAHENTPTDLLVEEDKTTPLNKYIQQQPEDTLGSKTIELIGRLPNLLKILQRRDTFSILT